MGTNEKLVPGELLKTTKMPPEINVWVERNIKNNGWTKLHCLTNKINEEIA